MTALELDAWRSEAEATGLLSGSSSAVDEQGLGWIVASLDVLGESVPVRILLSAGFPTSEPAIFIQPWDRLGYLPHVLPKLGAVCYAVSEGLMLNRQYPAAVLTWAVEEAKALLEKGVRGDNLTDFLEEIEVYWSYLNGKEVNNFFDPAATSCAISMLATAGQRDAVASSTAAVPHLYQPTGGNAFTKYSATYLVLPEATPFIPPLPGGPFWTVRQLRDFVKPALARLTVHQKAALFKKAKRSRGLLVLAFPRPDNRYSLIGVQYESTTGYHVLEGRGTDYKLRPVQLHRWERSYLVPRGGGKMHLLSKRVLLIGCGAIGGHLAHELMRAGVQQLTLLDHDTLSLENMYRHSLGMSGVGKLKVEALREELERKFLYARVEVIPHSLESAIATGKVELSAYDLVVAATGMAPLELYLNERLHALPESPPALFTWLEPYGLGGHALLTWPGRRAGCLRCLYTSDDADDGLVNRMLFARPHQHFSIALSGCHTLHTPYASLDASQTAVLAARLAVGALTGRQEDSPLWSWKGDSQEFKAAGFKLGPRYDVPTETLRREATLYRTPHCPVCGSRPLLATSPVLNGAN